nr:hypothetical protein [Tanacetum cinerariifolium]
MVRRDDDKLYKFKEGDFKRLRIQYIIDMLLLLVQGKLTNMTVEECFAFNVSLWMFTRSIVIQGRMENLQLGVESYQKKLNLTNPDTYRLNLKRKEAYTTYSNPRGFIYQNKDKKNIIFAARGTSMKILKVVVDEVVKWNNMTTSVVRCEGSSSGEVDCTGSSANADSLADTCQDLDPIVDLPALLLVVSNRALADSDSLTSLRLFDPRSGPTEGSSSLSSSSSRLLFRVIVSPYA